MSVQWPNSIESFSKIEFQRLEVDQSLKLQLAWHVNYVQCPKSNHLLFKIVKSFIFPNSRSQNFDSDESYYFKNVQNLILTHSKESKIKILMKIFSISSHLLFIKGLFILGALWLDTFSKSALFLAQGGSKRALGQNQWLVPVHPCGHWSVSDQPTCGHTFFSGILFWRLSQIRGTFSWISTL